MARPMRAAAFAVGVASGFHIGYEFLRAVQSVRALRLQPGKARERSAERYGALRRTLMLAGMARSLASASELAYGPSGTKIEHAVERAPLWLQPGLFTLGATLLDALLDLPVDFIEGFRVEQQFAMSEQSARSWASDRAKELAVSTAVMLPLSIALGAALRRFPGKWPWIAAAAAFPLLVGANIVVPIFVLPLFNTYVPLEGALETRLRALAARYGAGKAQILRVDMSKQTKKANAFVIGIGRTHRIVVGDTLIDHFTPDETEFVVAHELGHYVHRDMWRSIAAGQIAATLLLALTGAALRGADPAKPRTLARLQFWMLLISMPLRPLLAAFSRSREWAADGFALSATGEGKWGAAAFRRLRDRNLAEDEQPPWFEALFSTHPSLRARISALDRAPGSEATPSGPSAR